MFKSIQITKAFHQYHHNQENPDCLTSLNRSFHMSHVKGHSDVRKRYK